VLIQYPVALSGAKTHCQGVQRVVPAVFGAEPEAEPPGRLSEAEPVPGRGIAGLDVGGPRTLPT
jgi:hypothetical protein